MATDVAAVPPSSSYPVTFDVQYPQELSRWLIFVKWLLAVPHYIVVALYSLAIFFASLYSFFAILFTGRFPSGLFDFVVGYNRWYFRVYGYVFLLCDKYPPFSGEYDSEYPVRLDCQYPERLSRGLLFVKWLLVIPHWVVLIFYGLAVLLVTIVAWFSILFTARYPRPLFDFVVGYFRWTARVIMYAGSWSVYNPYHGGLLTDKYPPFSMEA